MTRRRRLALLVVAAMAVATAAWAYWTVAGGGPGAASAGTLDAPSGVSASTTAGSSTVQLAWTGSTLSGGQSPTGYYATRVRTGDGATAAACGTSPWALTTSTGCNDLNVPDGTYHYVVTAAYHSWTATSGASDDVTVAGDSAAPAVTIAFPRDGAAYDAAGWSGGCPTTGLCGTASDPSGVAAVSLSVRQGTSGLYWGGSSFDQASETFVPATGTTSWALGFARPPDGSYTVHARAADTLGNTTPSGSYATSTFTVDTAAPTLSSLQLLDGDGNGKVDQVRATFSETLAASTATAPWTLANVPSGGSLASVATAGSVATLTLSEGAGAQDTAVGGFTVALAANAAGIRDAAGNLSSFAATAPADKAGPVVVGITSSGGVRGRMEAGDQLAVTFSEPLLASSVPSSATVSERDPSGSGNDVLSIGGITNSDRDTGSNGYVTGNNSTASFASSTVALSAGTVTVTVGSTCAGGGCASVAASQGVLSFAPATGITDAAANAAAGTFATATGFQLF
jgi:hypothetical protein